MAPTKDDRIDVRINSQLKSDLERVARYRGLKPAVLIHSLIAELINEEKLKRPQIFEEPNVQKASQDEDEEWSIQQPAYEEKFDKKDKEKAS